VRRTNALLAALAVLAVPLLRADQAPVPGRVRGEVRVARVVLDAYVTDGAGDAIPDLAPSDFRVRAGGKEMEVESAEWIPAGKSEGLAEAAGPASGEAPPGVRYPPGRILVFFIQADIGRHRAKGLVRVRSEIGRLLDTLVPADRAAVVRFDSHLTLLCDLTADRSALEAAFDEGLLQGTSPPVTFSPFPSLAANFDFNAGRRAANVERALDLVSRALLPIPGGKALLFLGWGLGIDRAPREAADLSRAFATMAAARISVFTLDVSDADWHTLETTLQETSALTGGTYAKTHIFARGAVSRLAKSLEGRYVLVCVVPDDGDLSHLDVTLRKRRGEVVSRAYTFAP
jgi:VWFA-related protein